MKPEVDGVEVQELGSLGNAFQEHAVPLLGPGKALAFDGQRFGIPVGDIEFGLLQGDDVDDLVSKHARPVERHPSCFRAGEGDHATGAGTDGGDERQADRPTAEPLVVLEDFDLGAAGRLVAEAACQRGVDRFEVPRHVTAQELILGRVEQDAEVRRSRCGNSAAMCLRTRIMLSARTLNGSAAKAASKRLLASVSRPICM